jgi:hypothetical protein
LRTIYRTFESTPLPPSFSISHELCGITLILHLDYFFDKYQFGLRFVEPVRISSFHVPYSQSLVLRISMNAMPSLPLPVTSGQRARDSQQRWLGWMPLDPFYMAMRLYPLSPNIPATPHLAYLGGTIYSASSENLLTTITKTCQTFIITSCPFEWKATLTMKARTVNMSGHRLFWTAGEPCRWISQNTKSARDSLQSGPPQ